MRRGIGEALVVDLSARLKELDFETLEVTANPHAMLFYEHLGFVEARIVGTQFYPAPRMRRAISWLDRASHVPGDQSPLGGSPPCLDDPDDG